MTSEERVEYIDSSGKRTIEESRLSHEHEQLVKGARNDSESAYLTSIPGLKDDILAASAEPLSDTIPDSDVWR